MINRIADWMKGEGMLLILTLFGITGAVLLWVNTQTWGIGVGYDSYFYLSAADNFTIGNGLSRIDGDGTLIPLVHFPLVYPVILAATGSLVAGDTIIAARLIAMFFLGVNIILIGWLTYVYTNSMLAGLLGSGIALVSPFLLEIHLMAMSEPIFLTTILLTIHALAQWVQNGKLKLLTISGGLAGLTFLIRYAGTSTIALGVIVILIFGRFNLSQRIRHAMHFGFVSMLITVPWLIRNWVLAGTFTNRTTAFHLPDSAKLMKGIYVASTWITPISNPGMLTTNNIAIVRLLFVLVAIVFGIIIWVMKLRRSSEKLDSDNRGIHFVAILSIYMGIYILFIFVSLSFFDASTRLNNRILSPVYVVGIIMGFIVIWRGYSVMSSRIKLLVILIIPVLLISQANFDRYQQVLERMNTRGAGFTGRDWQTSETMNVVTSLPSELTIFTNESIAIYILTGQLTRPIPENFNPVKQEPNSTFDAQMEELMEVFRLGNGALVLFDSYYEHDVYASEAQLTQGLILWRDTADGSVYVPEGFAP